MPSGSRVVLKTLGGGRLVYEQAGAEKYSTAMHCRATHASRQGVAQLVQPAPHDAGVMGTVTSGGQPLQVHEQLQTDPDALPPAPLGPLPPVPSGLPPTPTPAPSSPPAPASPVAEHAQVPHALASGRQLWVERSPFGHSHSCVCPTTQGGGCWSSLPLSQADGTMPTTPTRIRTERPVSDIPATPLRYRSRAAEA